MPGSKELSVKEIQDLIPIISDSQQKKYPDSYLEAPTYVIQGDKTSDLPGRPVEKYDFSVLSKTLSTINLAPGQTANFIICLNTASELTPIHTISAYMINTENNTLVFIFDPARGAATHNSSTHSIVLAFRNHLEAQKIANPSNPSAAYKIIVDSTCSKKMAIHARYLPYNH